VPAAWLEFMGIDELWDPDGILCCAMTLMGLDGKMREGCSFEESVGRIIYIHPSS
jgi:hypothetical protein